MTTALGSTSDWIPTRRSPVMPQKGALKKNLLVSLAVYCQTPNPSHRRLNALSTGQSR